VARFLSHEVEAGTLLLCKPLIRLRPEPYFLAPLSEGTE
jgi:hypothetical protein